MNPALNSSLARYSLVGLLAAAAIYFLVGIAEKRYVGGSGVASWLAFALATGAAYYGSHRWVFGLKGNHQTHFVRFLAHILASYLCFHVLAFLLADVEWPIQVFAQGALAIVVLVFGYFVSRRWSMAPPGGGNEAAASWMALGTVVSLLVAAQVFVRLHGTSFNHDTSWFFVATRMWAKGASLYSDVMEVNPPFVFYFIRLTQAIGSAFGLSDENSLRLVLFWLAGVSVFFSTKVLGVPAISAQQRASMMVIGTVALLVIPLANFGQREHIFVIFVLPYLMSQAVRYSGHDISDRLRVLCVLFGIPGMLLKPYFLLLPLLLFLHKALQARHGSRMVSLEDGLIAFFSLMYLALVYGLHPDYLQTVVPLARLVYSSYGRSLEEIVFDPMLLALPLCCLPMLIRVATKDDSRFATVLLVAALASLAMYLIQFKGWNYHAIPYGVTTFLLAGWLLTSGIGLRSWRAWCFVTIPFVFVLNLVVLPQVEKGPYASWSAKVIQGSLNVEPGSSVAVYSTNVWLAFPFVNEAKLEWTSRYPAQWVVPGAFVSLKRAGLSDPNRSYAFAAALDYARQTAVADFVKNRPDLVVVDVRPVKSYFEGYSFDWIEFLSGEAVFRESWSDYQLVREYANIQIWRRKTAQGRPFPGAQT